MSIFLDLTGPVGYYLLPEGNYQCFFRPCRSWKDAAIREVSIITAPVLFSLISIYGAGHAGHELLKGAGNTITGDFSDAKENLKNSARWIRFFLLIGLINLNQIHYLINIQ